MSKKDAFFHRLFKGMTPDRAAELSGITSRQVKYKYLKAWEALQADESEPEPEPEPTAEEKAAALAAYEARKATQPAPMPRLPTRCPLCQSDFECRHRNEPLPETSAQSTPQPYAFPPAPDTPSQLANVVGDPFGRSIAPWDADAAWRQFQQAREDEAAQRRWLIGQIRGTHE
jgi:hypothetical protein